MAIALIAAVSVPAAAGAEETQISTDRATAVDADGPWVSWGRDEAVGATHFLWRDGEARPFPDVASLQLGSDRRGRTLAIYRRNHGWPVRERILPGGPTRALIPNGSRFIDALVDKFRGTVGLKLPGRRGAPDRIYVRRPHARRFVRIATAENASDVEVGSGWLAYGELDLDEDVRRLRAVNFARRRAKPVTLVVEDASDDDTCGHAFNCNPPRGSGPSFGDFAMRGRHVYWAGTSNAGELRIFRVDLRDFSPEEFVPEHEVAWLAVAGGGRVVYAAPRGGVYVVDRPAWRASDIAVPTEG